MQDIERDSQGYLLMFILQENPIDPLQAKNKYRNPADGAIVTFEGMVRADEHKGSKVSGLLYVANDLECRTEGEKIIKEALSKFTISEALCIQRIGRLKTTELAVWIGVWAPHRDQAFQACRYIIEEIKKRLLIWKKEFYTDGSSAWIHGSPAPVGP
jgi:molybdopterin synthase catalytic subunit